MAPPSSYYHASQSVVDLHALLCARHGTSHTPYEVERSSFESFSSDALRRLTLNCRPPAGTIHTQLAGCCAFIPFPKTSIEMEMDIARWQDAASTHASSDRSSGTNSPRSRASLADSLASLTAGSSTPMKQTSQRVHRLFVGQMPFFAEEMHVAWLFSLFGATGVIEIQKILKSVQTARGVLKRLPTGGFHVQCDAPTMSRVIQVMHKRMLIDATGVWFAATHKDKGFLDAHVCALRDGSLPRPRGMPYETVVAQEATSERFASRTAAGPRVATVSSPAAAMNRRRPSVDIALPRTVFDEMSNHSSFAVDGGHNLAGASAWNAPQQLESELLEEKF